MQSKTGDLNNNLERLKQELRQLKQIELVTPKLMAEGNALAFLPIIHFITLEYSKQVAKFIYDLGYELYSKNDYRFIEAVFKLLKVNFNYRVKLSPEQFFTQGFAEQKIILCIDLIHLIKNKHFELKSNLQNKQYQSSYKKRQYSNTSREGAKIITTLIPEASPIPITSNLMRPYDVQSPNPTGIMSELQHIQNQPNTQSSYQQYQPFRYSQNIKYEEKQTQESNKLNLEQDEQEVTNQEEINKEILQMFHKFTFTIDSLKDKIDKMESTFQNQIDKLSNSLFMIEGKMVSIENQNKQQQMENYEQRYAQEQIRRKEDINKQLQSQQISKITNDVQDQRKFGQDYQEIKQRDPQLQIKLQSTPLSYKSYQDIKLEALNLQNQTKAEHMYQAKSFLPSYGSQKEIKPYINIKIDPNLNTEEFLQKLQDKFEKTKDLLLQ